MDMNEYQQAARKTALYPGVGNNLIYPTLGLADEAGEVVGKVKKLIRDKHKFTPEELTDEERAEFKKEVGDVLWYVANFASEVGLTLDEVAVYNVEKLQSRQARGTLHGSGDDR